MNKFIAATLISATAFLHAQSADMQATLFGQDILKDFGWTNNAWQHPKASEGYHNCVMIKGAHRSGKRFITKALAARMGGHVIERTAKQCCDGTYWYQLRNVLPAKTILYIKDIELISNDELQRLFHFTRRQRPDVLFVFPVYPDTTIKRQQFINLEITTPDSQLRQGVLKQLANGLILSDVTWDDIVEYTDEFEIGELISFMKHIHRVLTEQASKKVTEDEVLDAAAAVLEERIAIESAYLNASKEEETE